MAFKIDYPRRTRRLISVGLALLFSVVLSGCSLFGAQELSYARQIIQRGRQFHLTTPGSGESTIIIDELDLGPVLRWSPDGTQMIVEQERGSYYLADPETGQIGECITCDMPDAKTAEYSPDGESVAIGATSGLYLAEISDGSPIQLNDFSRPWWIDWSPDGTQIVFSGRSNGDGSGRLDIFIFDLESGELSNLTENLGADQEEFFSPRWSPDGQQIAFHRLSRDGFSIMVIGSDGSDFGAVTDWTFRQGGFFPQTVRPPQWSPNGKQLLFESYDAATPRFGQEIYVVNIDGSEKTNLTRSPGSESSPVWSSNGRLIAFVTDIDGNGEIYVMDADGGNPTNVSNMPLTDELLPFWRP